jgi:hypothetical protein
MGEGHRRLPLRLQPGRPPLHPQDGRQIGGVGRPRHQDPLPNTPLDRLLTAVHRLYGTWRSADWARHRSFASKKTRFVFSTS